LKVYLPVGYDASDQRYPTLYVNYGRLSIDAARIPNTLDNLIGKTVRPVIAVFIYTPNGFAEYARAQRDQYAEMVAKELVPFIDKTYRTIAKAEARAFMGGDEGGYAAINTAFQHPGVIGMLAGQSTHLLTGAGGDELRDLIRNSEKIPVRFYLDWGAYDYRNTQGGYSWITDNKNLVTMLEEKGYSWTGGEVSEGWGFASWRNRTDKILEEFFPLQKTNK
jgi:enterochelin esterase-like enzyme